MPVYFLTLHAYRSWMPDPPRGYVRRHRGILPPDPEVARAYRRRARNERVVFRGKVVARLIEAARAVCRENRWRLHQVMVVWSHVHVLASWREARAGQSARKALKHSLTTYLRDALGRPAPWFTRAGSVRQVLGEARFGFLMDEYLPRHLRYGGKYWREDGKTP